MGRRERNHARTRATLLANAYRLFREQGYDPTTVDEIADAARVSTRTFYRYFPSKDAVLAERGLEMTDEVLDRVPPGASVFELAETYAAVMDEAQADGQFEMFARLLRENPRLVDCVPVWREAWARRLADGLAALDGRDDLDLDCRLRSALAHQLIAIAVGEWLYERRHESLVAVSRDVAAVGRRHLGPRSWAP